MTDTLLNVNSLAMLSLSHVHPLITRFHHVRDALAIHDDNRSLVDNKYGHARSG